MDRFWRGYRSRAQVVASRDQRGAVLQVDRARTQDKLVTAGELAAAHGCTIQHVRKVLRDAGVTAMGKEPGLRGNRLLYRADDANRAWTHRPSRRERTSQPDPVRHGTEHAYRRHKCRCRRCKAWRAGEAHRVRGGRPRLFTAIDHVAEAIADPTLTESETLAAITSSRHTADGVGWRWRVLALLVVADGPLRLVDIAERLGATKTAVATAVDQLRDVGLVVGEGRKWSRRFRAVAEFGSAPTL